MSPLLEAIQTKWNSTSTLTTAFPNALFLEHAPRNVAQGAKYVVYSVEAAPTTGIFGALPYEATITFEIMSCDPDTILDDAKKITDTFDNVILTLGSGTHVSTFRANQPIIRHVAPLGPDEFGGYGACDITYRFAVDTR